VKRNQILLDLLLTFMKIGLFTFGGGYAMIPVISSICVEQKKWISHDEMMDITVIAESTPGPMAINCATFVGYQQAGFAGSVIATFGIVLPSFAVIYMISRFLDHFLEITVVASMLKGIKLAVGLLILDAAVAMLRKMPKKPLPRAIMLGSFTVMLLAGFFSWRVSSISLMLSAAVVSLGVSAWSSMSARKDGAEQ
jgi:chromate transporter